MVIGQGAVAKADLFLQLPSPGVCLRGCSLRLCQLRDVHKEVCLFIFCPTCLATLEWGVFRLSSPRHCRNRSASVWSSLFNSDVTAPEEPRLVQLEGARPWLWCPCPGNVPVVAICCCRWHLGPQPGTYTLISYPPMYTHKMQPWRRVMFYWGKQTKADDRSAVW